MKINQIPIVVFLLIKITLTKSADNLYSTKETNFHVLSLVKRSTDNIKDTDNSGLGSIAHYNGGTHLSGPMHIYFGSHAHIYLANVMHVTKNDAGEHVTGTGFGEGDNGSKEKVMSTDSQGETVPSKKSTATLPNPNEQQTTPRSTSIPPTSPTSPAVSSTSTFSTVASTKASSSTSAPIKTTTLGSSTTALPATLPPESAPAAITTITSQAKNPANFGVESNELIKGNELQSSDER